VAVIEDLQYKLIQLRPVSADAKKQSAVLRNERWEEICQQAAIISHPAVQDLLKEVQIGRISAGRAELLPEDHPTDHLQRVRKRIWSYYRSKLVWR